MTKVLNHQHLFYFWQVAREGSMLAAAKSLGISQPTISVQIGELEKFFGKPLFERHGKSLELTDFGRLVAKYAEEIFAISSELVDVALGRHGTLPSRVRIGIVDVIPKSVAYDILRPLTGEASLEHCVLSVSEEPLEKLLGGITSRTLDVVISDSPLPPDSRARILSRKLMSLPVNLVANVDMAILLRRKFPASLNGAPVLLPKRNTMLRRELDLWFHEHKVLPKILGEFDDTALMKEFTRSGFGSMPMAGVPSEESGLQVVGQLFGLSQSFFLLFPERRNIDTIARLFPSYSSKR